ncbi:MAG: hypothetical protein J5882_05150, partial [Bacteroidales bacterium]|nr:hypothetical protein [Bacteroidales bacterium]
NKRGEKPDTLLLNDKNAEQNAPQPKKEIVDEFVDASDSEDITRFDSLRKKKKKKKKNKAAQQPAPESAEQPQMLTVSPVPQPKQPQPPTVQQPVSQQPGGDKRMNVKFNNNKNNQNKRFNGVKNRNGDYYQKNNQPPKPNN